MDRKILKKVICCVTLAAFITASVPFSYAQNIVPMPAPGAMVNLSPVFMPAILKGMKVYPKEPFRFDFVMDTGNSGLNGEALKPEASRIVRYFLASLTIPEKDLWVNLSPYEGDRIIPDAFGQTEMGRDLLAEDYILKQLSSSLMYPESALGKALWKKVYALAFEKYGTTDVPMDTFNKVWILPDEATVYVNGNTAVIKSSHLKVMLESDYLAQENSGIPHPIGARNDEGSQELAKTVIREVILPVIEKEVNEGANFAQLRQIYHAMVLATWFKRNLKGTLVGRAYMDSNKVRGIDLVEKDTKEQIWRQYVDGFKKGVFNYIKEEYDELTQETIPRKYFSGGFHDNAAAVHETEASLEMMTSAAELSTGVSVVAQVNLIKTAAALMVGDGGDELIGPALLVGALDPAMSALAQELMRLNGEVFKVSPADYDAGLEEMYRIFLNSQKHRDFYLEQRVQGNPFVAFLSGLRQRGLPGKFQGFISAVQEEMKQQFDARKRAEFQYGAAVWIMRFISANADYDKDIYSKKDDKSIRSLWNVVIGRSKFFSRSKTRKYICDSYSTLMVALGEEMGLPQGVLTRIPVLVGHDGEVYPEGGPQGEKDKPGHVAVLFRVSGVRAEMLDQGNTEVPHREVQVMGADGQWRKVGTGEISSGRGETMSEIKDVYRAVLENNRDREKLASLDTKDPVEAVKALFAMKAKVEMDGRSSALLRHNDRGVNHRSLVMLVELALVSAQSGQRQQEARKLFDGGDFQKAAVVFGRQADFLQEVKTRFSPGNFQEANIIRNGRVFTYPDYIAGLEKERQVALGNKAAAEQNAAGRAVNVKTSSVFERVQSVSAESERLQREAGRLFDIRDFRASARGFQHLADHLQAAKGKFRSEDFQGANITQNGAPLTYQVYIAGLEEGIKVALQNRLAALHNADAAQEEGLKKGGIDLNSELLKLSETGGKVDLGDTADIAFSDQQIDGFTPVVFSITPFNDSQAFFAR